MTPHHVGTMLTGHQKLMFNIGLGELFFIALLALVVVGPERLPKVMREFGRIVRQIRLVVNEMTSQFADELQPIQELQEPIQELQQLVSDINPVKQVTKIAVDLDTKANTSPTATIIQNAPPKNAKPSNLVKPTAAFRTSPPPRPATNPVKIIAQAKSHEPQQPSSEQHDS